MTVVIIKRILAPSVNRGGFRMRRQSGPDSKAGVWSLNTDVPSSPREEHDRMTFNFQLKKVIKTTMTTSRVSKFAFKVEPLPSATTRGSNSTTDSFCLFVCLFL